MRQNAVGVGDGGDDPGDHVIQQREYLIRAKGTIISLGPEMGAGVRVHELHGDAQCGPRLSKTAFHHVACAEFLADSADVDGCVGISQCGAARNYSEVRETRQTCHNVFGQSLGKGRDLTQREADALAGQWYREFTSQHLDNAGSPTRWSSLREILWDRAALAGDPIDLVAGESDPPSNLSAAGQEDIMVRVRKDSGEGEKGRRFWIWLAADNLKLAALNAIACATELRRLRPLGKVQ